jgi:hypothetical protein
MVKPGSSGEPGSVGINGVSHVVNNTMVSGGWVSGGALSCTGNFEVGHDLVVGGDMTGIGRIAVKGKIQVSGSNRMIGWVDTTTIAQGGAVALPCPCGASQILDVKAKVAAAKAQNDNGKLGLPASIKQIGAAQLVLPTGSYYFGDVQSIGLLRLRIEGAVALHLDGDLETIGADLFDIVPGGVLDLYVAGHVRTVGYIRTGEKSAPSAFRLFVGGSDTVTLSVGAQIFNGSIYAPTAVIAYVGHTVVRGGLFARRLTGIGNLVITGTRPVTPDPSVCAPPDPGKPTPQPTPVPTDTTPIL